MFPLLTTARHSSLTVNLIITKLQPRSTPGALFLRHILVPCNGHPIQGGMEKSFDKGHGAASRDSLLLPRRDAVFLNRFGMLVPSTSFFIVS